jgi:hypothetical protein
MWRTRLANSDSPFPAAVGIDRGRELFDGRAVASWLVDTQHGNNPEADIDLEAHAVVTYLLPKGAAAFHAMTALIVLAAIRPAALSATTVDALLDLADECDPDDEELFRELESRRADVLELAHMAQRLVEADYNPASALERLMGARHRLGLKAESQVALTASALDLLAEITSELFRIAPGSLRPPIVDATRGSGDALIALSEKIADDLAVAVPISDSPSVRLARRRLRARGVPTSSFAVGALGEFSVDGPAVHLAQLPSSDVHDASPAEILTIVEQIVSQCDDSHSGVIIGPASVLVDSLATASVDRARSNLLREGRVRAIVALPAGLLTTRPREATALWILGSAHASVPLAERWTLVADLSATTLTNAVVTDLVSDLVAGLGSPFEVRAHSFAFARPVFTSRLLARGGDLRSEVSTGSRTRHDAGSASSIVESLALPWSLQPSVVRGPAPISVDGAITAGHLRYFPGARLAAHETSSVPGARVLGVPELTSGTSLRHIDRLQFAADHPNARLTEPGDIVFCTSPRNAAMVDVDGSSVVEYPARILRINPADAGGLVAEVIGCDVQSAPPLQSWRRWALRRVPPGQATLIAEALGTLREERTAAETRLAQLDRATDLITSAVTSGEATLRPTNTKGP